MFRNYLWHLLLLWMQLSARLYAQKCDNARCNHEGVCELVGLQPKCTCIGTTYYKGEHCTEMVDNCQPNPCKNGAPCINTLGHALCTPCPANYGGDLCEWNNPLPGIFTNWYVHYNRYGYFGESQTFLTTVETLGDVDFSYELTTENIAIDVFETKINGPAEKLRWTYSDNLVVIAKRYGLRHTDKMPYRRGFYHVSSEKFFDVGLQQITVNVYSTNQVSEHYQYQDHYLQILQPDDLKCIPKIDFVHCSNPNKPLFLDIAKYNNFEPIIRKRCAWNSIFTYRWVVYNSIGTVELHDFGETSLPLLKIPPYRMWFEYYGEVMQSYMILLEAIENFGTDLGWVRIFTRCYVFVMSKLVKAIISGGEKREIYVSDTNVLDGSQSRDFALSPTVKQKMNFRWDCVSTDDSGNNFCRANIGNENKLRIPAGVLQLDKSYTFTFSIRSIVNIFVEDIAQQTVKVIAQKQLDIAIICVRNCENEEFSPAQPLHLMAQCIACKGDQSITYDWKYAGNSVGTLKRLIFTADDVPTILVELIVSDNGFQGKSSLKLRKNPPPQGGGCTITPTNGVVYETDFTIECLNYEDINTPIMYQFIAGVFWVDRTNEPRAHVRLPQVNSVKVLICDVFQACVETSVTVSVTPATLPLDVALLKNYFQQTESNMRKMLENGDIQRAMVLTHTLTKQVTTWEAAECIIDQMNNFELKTLLQVEQMTGITKNLIEPLKPLDNKKARLFAKYFEKMATGFKNVIDDHEAREVLKEPYELMTNDMSTMLTEFAEPLETIPEVQIIQAEHVDAENRLVEKYPDFIDFDITVLPRVENWLTAARHLDKCIHYLGLIAANMHEPGEQHFLIDRDGLIVEVYALEGTVKRVITTPDNATSVTMSSAMLFELQQQLKDEHVLLQVAALDKNPFWWYPDERTLSTEVFYLSAFSRNIDYKRDLQLKNAFQFKLKLIDANTTTINLEPANGYLNSSLDMPIFDIPMPSNSLLIVKFLSATTEMRIVLQRDCKPRGYEVRKSKLIVPAQSTNTKFKLLNKKCEKETAMAYLAVMSSNIINERQTFTFVAELRECLSWNFNLPDPQWSRTGCMPTLDDSTDSLHCNCDHLSKFAGKVYPTAVEAVFGERKLLESLPINWYMVMFYLLLVMIFLFLLFAAYRGLHNNKEQLIVEITDRNSDEPFDLLVHINTGGYENAGTSANVILIFSTLSGPRKFVIFQDPEDPHLTQNSTCTLKLPINGNELVSPPMIAVSHDNAGRYPSWYCRTIELEDLQNEKTQIYRVEKWISQNAVYLKESEIIERSTQSKYAKFRQTFERLHIHWFQFQPLFGPWRYTTDGLNRFERTCIWVLKTCVSICLVVCYFGSTTLENYEEERERYHDLSFDVWELLLLCVICYFVGILVEFFLKYFFIK